VYFIFVFPIQTWANPIFYWISKYKAKKQKQNKTQLQYFAVQFQLQLNQFESGTKN